MMTTNVILMTSKRILCRCADQYEPIITKSELDGELLLFAASTRKMADGLGIDNFNNQEDSFVAKHGWASQDKIGFYAVRSV